MVLRRGVRRVALMKFRCIAQLLDRTAVLFRQHQRRRHSGLPGPLVWIRRGQCLKRGRLRNAQLEQMFSVSPPEADVATDIRRGRVWAMSGHWKECAGVSLTRP